MPMLHKQCKAIAQAQNILAFSWQGTVLVVHVYDIRFISTKACASTVVVLGQIACRSYAGMYNSHHDTPYTCNHSLMCAGICQAQGGGVQ